eukprot:Filipodium_phascolosomae@DN1068_c0_g1_i1.p1
MSGYIYLLTLLIFLAPHVVFSATKAEVIDLGSIAELENLINTTSYSLVLYYATWCFWSRQMMDHFHAASVMMKGHDPAIMLARVDVVQHPTVQDKYNIAMLPTLRFYADAHEIDYTGGRSVNEIVNWINRAMDRDHKLPGIAELEEFLSHSDLRVLGVFPDDHNKTAYQHVARVHDDVLFADITHPEALKILISSSKHLVLPSSNNNEEASEITTTTRTTSSSGPWIIFFTPHDSKPVVFGGDVHSHQQLADFVMAHKRPAVTAFDMTTAEILFQDGRPILFLLNGGATQGSEEASEASNKKVVEVDSSPAFEAFQTICRSASSVVCAVSTTDTPIGKRLLELLGIDEEAEFPLIRLAESNPHSNGHWKPAHKYQLEDEITTDSLLHFIQRFSRKDLKAYMKSEPVPEQQDEGAPMVIVGSSFQDIVMNPAKDVFVIFYAPWCGHCRRLDPIVREVVEKLHTVKSLVIGKIDATSNEVEGVHINGYPSMFLYPAKDKKSPREFPTFHERTTAAITTFLQQHTSFPFQIPVARPAGGGDNASEIGGQEEDQWEEL